MAKPEILAVPPVEAVEHFRAKGYHVGFGWLDTDAAEHLRSFTVAKAMRLDVLEDLRREVDRAIAAGITFEDFHKELEPRLKARGWWGRQRMVDPLTGESRVVQLGSPRRLRIIFDTNLRMSYAKGRWERIERVAESRPWLRYVAVQDARTRPEHMAWHGTVLPFDHPFWQTHYPPNGWRCRCTVEQLSDADLEEFGLTPSEGPPPGSGRTRPWTNKRSGETVRVPAGIDPGFQHNPGRLNLGRDAADRMTQKIDAAEPALARAAIGNPWRTAMFRRHLSGASDGDWPVGVVDQGIRAAVGAKSRTVRLSGETAAKQTGRHQDLRSEDYARVQRILDEGELFAARHGRVMAFLEMDAQLWRAVLKVTGDRSETYLVSLHKAQPHNVEAARRRWSKIDHGGERSAPGGS